MIYSIVGTHHRLREKGNKELSALGKAMHHIYSEQIGELESLINATSLFGDPVIVVCIQLGEVTSSKEELKRLLDSMSASTNIFIIDEPFADVHLVNTLSKVSKKLFNSGSITDLFACDTPFLKSMISSIPCFSFSVSFILLK